MTDPASIALSRPAPRAASGRRTAARTAAPRRPSATSVAMATLAVFLACFTFLAWQLHAGRDPSLGQPSAPVTQRVLVKRIERKVVVTKVLPAEADDSAAGAGSGGSSVQVVQSSSAPSAPAPTTRSS